MSKKRSTHLGEVGHQRSPTTPIDRIRNAEDWTFENWLRTVSGHRWKIARQIWAEVLSRFPELLPPAAIDHETSIAHLAWSLPRIYVKVEVTEGGEIQAFWNWLV